MFLGDPGKVIRNFITMQKGDSTSFVKNILGGEESTDSTTWQELVAAAQAKGIEVTDEDTIDTLAAKLKDI